MSGRPNSWTAHLMLALLVLTSAGRCSGDQQQHSGDAQEQLLALVSRAVAAAADPIRAELGSQRTLLDSIVSRLDSQDVRLDGIASQLDEINARLSTLNTRLNSQDASQNASQDTQQHQQVLPRDCSDLPPGAGNGIYTLQPGLGGANAPAEAFCDLTTDGGGWTVIQRRADILPRQSFYQTWDEYRQGFGNLTGEFWWGLQKLWVMTSALDRRYELRVELEDFDGEKRYALYQDFAISSEDDGYRLTFTNYSGDAGDSLSNQKGQRFSSKDRDQDSWGGHCAEDRRGGFWYNDCATANLNGEYLYIDTPSVLGVTWKTWKGLYYSLKTVEMKVRPTRHV